MTTFEGRMLKATGGELLWLKALREAGWKYCPFGQGQLSEEVRRELQGTISSLRWLPDVIAVRPSIVAKPGIEVFGSVVGELHLSPLAIWIDFKSGRLDTPYHAIEQNAWQASFRLAQAGYDCIFAFGDMTWCWASDLRPSMLEPCPPGGGSGTQALRLKRFITRRFNSLLVYPYDDREPFWRDWLE